MDDKTREQAEAEGLAMVANLNDGSLCIAWAITEAATVTQELALTRGWIMHELHNRLGDDLFDEWLVAVDENGKGVDPLAYFERKDAAPKAYTPCWTCAQPSTHTLTREGSNTLHACDNCTRIDRTEAETRGWTITKLAR